MTDFGIVITAVVNLVGLFVLLAAFAHGYGRLQESVATMSKQIGALTKTLHEAFGARLGALENRVSTIEERCRNFHRE